MSERRGRGDARTCWLISDGKIGDEIPMRGVAEVLGLGLMKKTVAPRAFFAALAPWGPPDPHDGRRILQPPFPSIAFAAGRRAVPVLRALKRASPDTFTVFFGSPRTRPHGADVIWAPKHDDLRGETVIVTETAPHTRSPAALACASTTPDPRVARLPKPRAAVLIGGRSRKTRFDRDDEDALMSALATIRTAGFSLAVTTSRRTPDALRSRLHCAFGDDDATFVWDGAGENPYATMLALCDAIFVTADSTNMVGEALACGAPVHVFILKGGGRRHAVFVDGLVAQGVVRLWDGHLSVIRQAPVDATPTVAAAIASRLAAFQQARGD